MKMASQKGARLRALLLIVLCALPVLASLWVVFAGQKEISDAENRTLAQYPAASMDAFLSGEFQQTLEKALADQYPCGDKIKSAVKSAQNGIQSAEIALLVWLDKSTAQTYVAVGDGYYHFAGDEARIVEKPWAKEKYTVNLAANAEAFNAVTVPKYLYFIRNSRAQDFTLSDAENDGIYQDVLSFYHADQSACFKAADYEAFCADFYQTDHHWNADGAKKGYEEIVRMMFGDAEQPVQMTEKMDFGMVFNGSYARQTKLLCATETFSGFLYTLPRATVTLNGQKGTYGHQTLYEKGKAPTDELRNHYAYYYGGDFGEIIIQRGQTEKENLLLIADSYSNPLNLLLSTHFNTTCIIDLRYYERDMGEPFNMSDYIAAHDIGRVLMLGDIALYGGARGEEAAD